MRQAHEKRVTCNAAPPAILQAALEFLIRTGRQPDILHCHDWSTADVARTYWTDYHHYGLWKPRVVSPVAPPTWLPAMPRSQPRKRASCPALRTMHAGPQNTPPPPTHPPPPRPWQVFTIHNMDFGQIKLGEAAFYSQKFTTVSPSYAWEVSRPSPRRLAVLRPPSC